MTMKIDMHVHSARCGHASGTPAEYVAAARASGVDVMAFTDHLPLPARFDAGYAMPSSELAEYVDDVREAQRAAQAQGGLEILLGIEADWFAGCEPDLAEDLEEYPFDIVLGSVHFQGEWAFDDPRLTEEYQRRRIDRVWRRYFEDVAASARTRMFDVITHPDLVKKFNYLPDGELTPYYMIAIEAIAESGAAIEANSSGWRKPCEEIYPSPDFLKLAFKAGIPATLGSDAHKPSEVGQGLGEARMALLAAGYRSALVWRGRVPEEVEL